MRFILHPLILSCISGLLLGLSWYPETFYFIFIGLVPLLYAYGLPTEHANLKGFSSWIFNYLGFLIWNVVSTWWVAYASFAGALMAFILNSLFMTLVFRYSMQGLKRNSKSFQGLGLLIFWSGWEYFHQQWELSWPWLNLGNALASKPAWIQWFQFIGSSGGTLWVLLVNLLIFNALINYKNRIYKLTYAGIALGVVIIPIVASYIIGLKSETSAQERVAVVCVQPNSDPYHDKFSSNFNQQFKHIWLPLKNHLTAGTDLVVFPETFVSQAFDLKILKHSYILQTLRDSIFKYAPKARILTGLASYQIFEPGEAPSHTARSTAEPGYYIDFFNSAWWIDSLNSEYYHKSKLVPGSEIIPFSFLLKPLESLALNLGGTTGSLGTQKNRAVFKSKGSKIIAAPIICYESIYSDYVRDYTQLGANIFCIITNDGWWENTPGYKQHLRYAQLRAIENHRCIVRSANTGISAFIYPDGHIEQRTSWWNTQVISTLLPLYENRTLYAQTGDWIGKSSLLTSVLLMLFDLLKWLYRIIKKIAFRISNKEF